LKRKEKNIISPFYKGGLRGIKKEGRRKMVVKGGDVGG